MRALLGMLRSDDGPDGLKPQPGLADLDQLVRGVREAGLAVTLRIEGERRPLPLALDLSAFRIVQEALTNALKHAGLPRPEVTVRYQDGAVELEIADTGAGRSRARHRPWPGRHARAGRDVRRRARGGAVRRRWLHRTRAAAAGHVLGMPA